MNADTKTDRERIAAHLLTRFYSGEPDSAFYTILFHAEIPRVMLAKAGKRTGAENTTLSQLIAMAADKYACGLSDDEANEYLTEYADYI